MRGLSYPEDCGYDNLYKFALEKCLENCGYVAALVPESYIRSNLFQARLRTFVSLTNRMFGDTNHPVGLALFVPDKTSDVSMWSGANIIGELSDLRKKLPHT